MKIQFVKHHIVHYFVSFLFTGLFFSCQPTPKDLTILYDQTLEETKKLAKQDNKVICVVLTKPDCPSCSGFVQNLGERYGHLASKVIFNIVDVSLPENQWYPQWLCTGAFPTTCVFSANGELQAAIIGAAAACQQCVASAIAGDFKCARFFENPQFPAKGEQGVAMLNGLLFCKQNLEQSQDISTDIEPFLEYNRYPYSLFLKFLNEEKQGRHEDAVYWAKQMLALESPYYNFVYDTLYKQARSLVNPNYMNESGVLSVVKELKLDGCKYKEAKPFSLTLKNTGQSPLSIRNIAVSCTCLKLLSAKQQTLQPGQSVKVDLVFTPDVRGDVFREVTFFSDAVNSLEKVGVFALVK